MFPNAPLRLPAAFIPVAILAVAGALAAQSVPAVSGPGAVPLDWRHVGTTTLARELPSPSSGPVARVWYSPDGAGVFVRTADGDVYSTADFERWAAVTGEDTTSPREQPATLASTGSRLPESQVTLKSSPAMAGRLYAAGEFVYRSDNGGRSWRNLTQIGGESLLGGSISDVAASPANPDEAVVVNDYGVWVTHDAGLSWVGANEGLPNLPAKRILGLPGGRLGVRILVDDEGQTPQVFAWQPGQKVAWLPTLPANLGADLPPRLEEVLRATLSADLEATITSVAVNVRTLYAGSDDGRIWSSSDSGATWQTYSAGEGSGAVTSFYVDAADPRVALATFAESRSSPETPRVMRTVNGGLFWDDLSANLPDSAAYGAVADSTTGALYVATADGLFFTMSDLLAPAPATEWQRLSAGLPDAPALDVKLDGAGNQLYVLLDGFGVYATMAPHRLVQPALVHAADLQSGATAPGDLLSLLGASIREGDASGIRLPVLASGSLESQIQVPFEVSGDSIRLSLTDGQRQFSFGVTLRNVSPAIFVNRDGSALLMDADTGLQLDVMNPGRSGTRVQMIATGLGKVAPDWPSGTPAPRENVPRVVAPVSVLLDGNEVPVTRATLAPGYVGFYLVEFELPAVVNAGSAQLTLEAGGVSSNQVTIQLEP